MSTHQILREDLARSLSPDYEIVAELGRGGASVVYLARESALGREVAIKVIRDPLLENGEAAARLQREARVLARLQHPNIVTLYTARHLPDGSLALVMQHGPWRTLRWLLTTHGPVPIPTAERVLRDVAAALAYLHAHGVVHRDVKPENIFLDTETGRALLSDFGLARPEHGHESVTLAGVVIGTPAYMSPEQIQGAELDGQSDIYSLGMVGHEMLTGRRPWDGESLYSILYKQVNEPLAPLQNVRADVPDRLRTAIEAAIEKDRAQRLPSAEALLDRLLASGDPPAAQERVWLAADLPEAPPPDEIPTAQLQSTLAAIAGATEPAPRRARRTLVMAASILLILGVGGGAAALTLNSEPLRTEVADALGDGATVELPPVTATVPAPAAVHALPAAEQLPSPPPADTTLRAGEAEHGPAATREPAPQRVRPARAEPPAPPPANVAPPASEPVDPLSAEPIPAGRASPRVQLSAVPDEEVQPAATPTLDVHLREKSTPPELLNQEDIVRAIRRDYPEQLRRFGLGAAVEMIALVSRTGTVLELRTTQSSGHADFDRIAAEAAKHMQFRPARSGGTPVDAWVRVPLIVPSGGRD